MTSILNTINEFVFPDPTPFESAVNITDSVLGYIQHHSFASRLEYGPQAGSDKSSTTTKYIYNLSVKPFDDPQGIWRHPNLIPNIAEWSTNSDKIVDGFIGWLNSNLHPEAEVIEQVFLESESEVQREERSKETNHSSLYTFEIPEFSNGVKVTFKGLPSTDKEWRAPSTDKKWRAQTCIESTKPVDTESTLDTKTDGVEQFRDPGAWKDESD